MKTIQKSRAMLLLVLLVAGLFTTAFGQAGGTPNLPKPVQPKPLPELTQDCSKLRVRPEFKEFVDCLDNPTHACFSIFFAVNYRSFDRFSEVGSGEQKDGTDGFDKKTEFTCPWYRDKETGLGFNPYETITIAGESMKYNGQSFKMVSVGNGVFCGSKQDGDTTHYLTVALVKKHFQN